MQLALDTDHEMNTGNDPAALIAEADVILVLDSLAPWSANKRTLALIDVTIQS